MATEIERKFLLRDDSWQNEVSESIGIVQGYLANTTRASIRVRRQGNKANLNIKSMTIGICRSEYEYPIPVTEADAMLTSLCMRPLIEKTRYYLKRAPHLWEIDVFKAENQGLVVAEIELAAVDEDFERPPWLGEEVSDDERYYNASLIQYPFQDWK